MKARLPKREFSNETYRLRYELDGNCYMEERVSGDYPEVYIFQTVFDGNGDSKEKVSKYPYNSKLDGKAYRIQDGDTIVKYGVKHNVIFLFMWRAQMVGGRCVYRDINPDINSEHCRLYEKIRDTLMEMDLSDK